ncbi:MAG TPA: hypothetical protein VN673_17750 [Clostridia bacterium]|nr:hypothetical protein [Clostridia bacterium]
MNRSVQGPWAGLKAQETWRDAYHYYTFGITSTNYLELTHGFPYRKHLLPALTFLIQGWKGVWLELLEGLTGRLPNLGRCVIERLQ